MNDKINFDKTTVPFDPNKIYNFNSEIKKLINFDSNKKYDFRDEIKKLKNSLPVLEIKVPKEIKQQNHVENQDKVQKSTNWLKTFLIGSMFIIPTAGTAGYFASKALLVISQTSPFEFTQKDKASSINNLGPNKEVFRLNKVLDPSKSVNLKPKENIESVVPNYSVETKILPESLPFTNKDFVRREEGSLKVLKVKMPGKGIPFELELYKAKNSNEKYIDKKGVEYILRPSAVDDSFEIMNLQEMSASNNTIFIKPANGTKVYPATNAKVSESIKEFAAQGDQVESIIGTGAVRKADQKEIEDYKNGKNDFVTNYRYNPNEYWTPAGEIFVRLPNGKIKFTNNLENNRPSRDAGFYTLRDGSVHLLNLENLSIQTKIERLRNFRLDKNVMSYSMTGWMCNEKSNMNTVIGQVRSGMIFDKRNGKYIASMVTPTIGFQDMNTVAVDMYGENALVLATDGDFYGGVQTTEDSKGKLAKYNNPNMYFANAAIFLVRSTPYPKINTIDIKTANKIEDQLEEFHRSDFQRDVFNGLKYDPLGSLKKVMKKVSGKEF